MRRYPTYRYQCDHCKKRGGSRKFMAKHEASCTNNPNRVCGMCKAAQFEQRPLAELSDIYVESGFKALREACEDCPACVLATSRQTDFKRFGDCPMWGTPKWDSGDWNFKTACESFWEIHSSRPDYSDAY